MLINRWILLFGLCLSATQPLLAESPRRLQDLHIVKSVHGKKIYYVGEDVALPETISEQSVRWSLKKLDDGDGELAVEGSLLRAKRGSGKTKSTGYKLTAHLGGVDKSFI